MGSYSFTRFCSAGLILHVCRFESSIFVVYHHQSEPNKTHDYEKPITSSKATSFKNFIFSRAFLCLALISINLWRIKSANTFTRLWLKMYTLHLNKSE